MPAAVLALALLGTVDPAIWSGPPREAGPGFCVSCHAVQIDARLARPVRDVRLGVHFEKGVFCHDCHGGDPAASDVRFAKRADAGFLGVPGKLVDEAEFCGRCHEQALRAWRESGHAAGAKSQIPNPKSQIADAGCIACHASHAAKRASTDLINPKNCFGCHGFPEANALKTHIMQATTAILSTREQIKRFRAAGGGAFQEEAEVEALRVPLRAMYHMTDRETIKLATQQIREESVRASGRVKWLESGKNYREMIRRVWLAAAVIGAFVAGYHFTVAFRMKKMLKRAQTGQATGAG